MSSIMRARSAVTGRGEGWDIGGSSLRAEGCWTFNAQDRMPRSSPLTAHPLTANAKNAPAPTPPSRESGFVLGPKCVIREDIVERRCRGRTDDGGRDLVVAAAVEGVSLA